MNRSLVRWLLSTLGLLWLAAPHWPTQIDDVFITARYAAQWFESGEIAWGPGERLEGYSNFLWLLLMRLAWPLPVDPTLLAQCVSMLCASALLWRVAHDGPPGAAGGLLLLALTLWPPFAHWAAMGMETLLFAWLCASGHALALGAGRRRPLGVGLCALAALTRPEGSLWWLLALAASLRPDASGWRGPRHLALATLPVVLGYHAFRLLYFGDLIPAAVHMKAHFGAMGLQQPALELLSAAPLLALVSRLRRIPARDRAWTLAPLLISTAMLVSINGDWMGHGRLLLPGVLGCVMSSLALGEARPVSSRSLLVLAGLVLSLGNLQLPFMDTPRLRIPGQPGLSYYADGLDTPLPEHVRWLVQNAPAGATVQAADVGMISHIPLLTVVDARGLVSPRFARARASGDLRWLPGWYASPDRPDIVQVLQFSPPGGPAPRPPEGLDPWLRSADPALRRNYPFTHDMASRFDGWQGMTRFYRHDRALPSPRVRRQRWRALARRFPAQRMLVEAARESASPAM